MNNKYEDLIVIIPAYEPPVEFVEYAQSVSKIAKKLVIVNDGSNESYDKVFEEIIKNNEVVYLHYKENHGKGYALKYAFRYCIDNFSKDDLVVTADCDGQHKLEDVIKVYEASKDHKDALVLGSRDFRGNNVPKRSKSGNQQIRNMFKFFYGIELNDSQTGLRGCSVEVLKEFTSIKGDRFDFEHAELIYAKKHNIEILEVPIQTIYASNLKDHVSHFRTFRDSARVMWVMLKNIGAYAISSLVSAILDVVIFYLIARVIFKEVSAINTLIATISARVLSSIANFTLNYKYVFNGVSKKSIYRYYILWTLQLAASYGVVFLFGNLLGGALTIVKIIGDLCLALISYQVQQYWVFKKRSKRKFFGFFANTTLNIGRRFSKKYRCNVLPYDEPVVYVCRHLNMHGPYTTLKWLKFDVHPLILSPFFDKKQCYNQFNDYTFSVRNNKKRKRFSVKAFFASRAVSRTVNSLRAVPVYRGSFAIRNTFSKSMEYLLNNESLIVYPDINYTYASGEESEIYDGFLYLGELYYKKTGKSLRFIPIVIDDEKYSLNQAPGYEINDYGLQKSEISQKIKEALNRR